jgi:gliding motility-associated protein GldL
MALLSKKAMNFAYGMGAAVVIVGALFKIIHFELGPLTEQECFVGLLTEAFILRFHLSLWIMS